jgi:RNA polymerase sigma-54 factor
LELRKTLSFFDLVIPKQKRLFMARAGLVLGARQQQGTSQYIILTSKLLASNNQIATVNNILADNPLFEPIQHNNVDLDAFREKDYEIGSNSMAKALDDLGYKMSGDGHPFNEDIPLDRNRNFVNQEEFADAIREQVSTLSFNDRQREIAEFFILSVNDHGMVENQAQVYQFIHDQINVSIDEIGFVHQQLKDNVKPAGIFSTTVQESLQLQINDIKSDRTRTLIQHAFNNHYSLFVKKDFDGIAKAMGFSVATRQSFERDIQSALRSIEPYSVSLKSQSATNTFNVTSEPDYIVSKNPDGSMSVRPFGKTLDTIDKHLMDCLHASNIHTQSLERLIKSNSNPEAVKYYKEKLEQIREIRDMVKDTGKLKTQFIKAVLAHQEKFSTSKDLNDILPALQKDFSKEEGRTRLSPSMISNIVRSTVIEMDDGTRFQLGELFQRGVLTNDGIRVGFGDIKKSILDIIKNENINQPYSDLAITKQLREKGILINKEKLVQLREEMDIMPQEKRALTYTQHLSQRENAVSKNLSFEKSLELGQIKIYQEGKPIQAFFDIKGFQEGDSQTIKLYAQGPNNSQVQVAEVSSLKELRGLTKPKFEHSIKTEATPVKSQTSTSLEVGGLGAGL